MDQERETHQVIKTSNSGWLKQLAGAYKSHVPVLLEDDAGIGIDPRDDSILKMGRKANLSKRDWAAVFIALGMAGVGAWLLVLAVLDPEPFSKIVATILAGATLLGSGSLVAVRVLTHVKPPGIRVSKGGTSFEVFWD